MSAEDVVEKFETDFREDEKTAKNFIIYLEKETGEEIEKLTGKSSSIVSGVVGNIMEWYDFALYGYMVPIISKLFFPGQDAIVSIMATFAVFAVGFIMRPLGGAIFGHLGDLKGRKFTLYLSLIMIGISTSLIGVLPVYANVGLLAPALLVLLRMIQGLSVGGEFSSSVTYLVEEAPNGYRGVFGSIANIGSMVGMLLGSIIATGITSILSEQTLYAWGWRLPFFLSALLAVFGIYYTSKLPESHMYLRNKRHEATLPLKEVMKKGKRELVSGILFSMGYAVLFYLPLVYMPTYLNTVAKIDMSKTLQITTLITFILVFFIPLMAIISDRLIRRKKLLLGAFIIALIVTIPFFSLVMTKNYILIFAIELIFGLIIAVPLGIAPSMFVELFPTNFRLTAYSIIYNVGLGIFGGSAPMISTWLIKTSGNNLAPAYYLCFAVVLAIIGLYLMKDRSREPLR
ncbi:MFS transporter, MHS family, proline/betaine transporter [Methanolobus vulcani]|uniref:MFS transporter, MHS family, proline/betaine transporter n=1 Tax=Methanolobus vulcani TaxID=38026 RepID=A0A7Z7FEI5_9EURY|nr:MFS transporter [Methanolobus vulcani]MDK2825371.1 transporter, family, proline/betaine transporter [Methanolobus sp.]SDF93281.1 MFS transporter, MHS family, proline/betaine transporter [Methanolobus vulcani]